MLQEEIALQDAINDYTGFLGDFETVTLRLRNEIALIAERERIAGEIQGVQAGFDTFLTAASIVLNLTELLDAETTSAQRIIWDSLPKVNGASNDLTSAPRATITTFGTASGLVFTNARLVGEQAIAAAELTRDQVIVALEGKAARVDYVSEIEGMLAEIEQLAGAEGPLRGAIGGHLQSL